MAIASPLLSFWSQLFLHFQFEVSLYFYHVKIIKLYRIFILLRLAFDCGGCDCRHLESLRKSRATRLAAIVPIYNFYIMLKIIGKPTWWLLMLLIPFLNLVFLIWGYNMVSKSFGKDEGYPAGLVLLGFIFWPLLGFGDAKYLGPFGDPEKFRAMQMPSFDFDKKPNA
jgi:hypothetical protein